MAEEEGKLNGHRPNGLLNELLGAAGTLPKTLELKFDVDTALRAVVGLHAEVPDDARTAAYLGTERDGHGVLIDDDGLVLTIGYLIAEAERVTLTRADGSPVRARTVAYDYDTGFGLVRAEGPLDARALPLGRSAMAKEKQAVLVAGAGGRGNAIGAVVVSRREFAGYWEYLLDEAIFTAPPYANWGGAALIDSAGHLLGIGSLFVPDAQPGDKPVPGNMFVPIDLLPPILPELLRRGRGAGDLRPWLGMFTAEEQGQLTVAQVSPESPAARAGIKAGDMLVKVAGIVPRSMAGLYRHVWGLGPAGIEVPVTVLREDRALAFVIRTVDRYSFLKLLPRGL